jgi:hypothetical protein
MAFVDRKDQPPSVPSETLLGLTRKSRSPEAKRSTRVERQLAYAISRSWFAVRLARRFFLACRSRMIRLRFLVRLHMAHALCLSDSVAACALKRKYCLRHAYDNFPLRRRTLLRRLIEIYTDGGPGPTQGAGVTQGDGSARDTRHRYTTQRRAGPRGTARRERPPPGARAARGAGGRGGGEALLDRLPGSARGGVAQGRNLT